MMAHAYRDTDKEGRSGQERRLGGWVGLAVLKAPTQTNERESKKRRRAGILLLLLLWWKQAHRIPFDDKLSFDDSGHVFKTWGREASDSFFSDAKIARIFARM
jgi:hypothetical protein